MEMNLPTPICQGQTANIPEDTSNPFGAMAGNWPLIIYGSGNGEVSMG